MREELQQFQSERAERVRLLQDRQMRELEQFDAESMRRGFRYGIPMKLLYCYGEKEDSYACY